METHHHPPQSTYFALLNSKVGKVAHPGSPLPLRNKVFRILRHLNKDIQRNHPLVRQPSSYLLKKFVDNYLNSELGQQQRLQKRQELKFITEECLQFLHAKCLPNPAKGSFNDAQGLDNKANSLINSANGETVEPLFPNQESFSKCDALTYFQSAIHSYRLATTSTSSN